PSALSSFCWRIRKSPALLTRNAGSSSSASHSMTLTAGTAIDEFRTLLSVISSGTGADRQSGAGLASAVGVSGAESRPLHLDSHALSAAVDPGRRPLVDA